MSSVEETNINKTVGTAHSGTSDARVDQVEHVVHGKPRSFCKETGSTAGDGAAEAGTGGGGEDAFGDNAYPIEDSSTRGTAAAIAERVRERDQSQPPRLPETPQSQQQEPGEPRSRPVDRVSQTGRQEQADAIVLAEPRKSESIVQPLHDSADTTQAKRDVLSSTQLALADAHAVNHTGDLAAHGDRDQEKQGEREVDSASPDRVGGSITRLSAGRGAGMGDVMEERVASVRCYLRDDDPIFVRRNLKRLLAGSLAQLDVGDTVTVARRCRGGENKVGGPGSVSRVLPNLFYDVKYAVGGMERSVDACFLEKTQLLQGSRRRRRGSTPRCPDCNSFLHECTCAGVLGVTATAAVEAPGSESVAERPGQTRPPQLPTEPPRSLKRPRSAMGKDAILEVDAPRKPDDMQITPGVCEGECEGGFPLVQASRSDVGRDKYPESEKENERMDVENTGVENRDGRGTKALGGDEKSTEDKSLRLQPSNGGISGAVGPVDRVRVVEDGEGDHIEGTKSPRDVLERLKGRTHGPGDAEREPDEVALNSEIDRIEVVETQENQTEPVRDTPAHEISGSIQQSSARRDGEQTPGGETRGFRTEQSSSHGSILRDGDEQRAHASNCLPWAVDGDTPQSIFSNIDNEAARRPGLEHPGDGQTEADHPEQAWRAQKGDLVEVERRMMAGVNKPGGTGRVVKVDSTTGVVDVRYVVEGGWERGIDPMYVRPAVLHLGEKRPTLGRCPHCGSLRVDCRQGCEFYISPPFRQVLTPSAPRSSSLPDARLEGGSSPSAARDRGRTTNGSVGKDVRHKRIRKHRRSHLSRSDGPMGDADDDPDESGRRRRHLPDDWDEEGDPVLNTQMFAGDGSDSDMYSRSKGKGPGGQRRRRHWELGSDSDELGPSLEGHGDRRMKASASMDEDMESIRSAQRQHVSFSWDGSETSDESDANVEFFGVREGHGRGWRSRRGTENPAGDGLSDSDSDSDSDGRVYGFGDGEDDSEGEQSTGSIPDDAHELLRTGAGRRRRHGDTRAGGEGGEALFLMPEGEEASRMLPSDIADPTRGSKDPSVLRKELRRLLHEIEGREAINLERDVPAVCRRVASSVAGGAPANDGNLKQDLPDVIARLTRTLRSLDVANNIYVRLEKLEARWREGMDGENAWHRLDGLSQRLEQLRRDVEKADRRFAESGADNEDHLSSGVDGSDGGGSSLGDFDLEARGPRHLQPATAAELRRRRDRTKARRQAEGSSSKRSARKHGRNAKVRGQGSSTAQEGESSVLLHEESGIGVDGNRTEQLTDHLGSSGRSRGHTAAERPGLGSGRGKKRSRQVSSAGRENRRCVAAVHPRGAVGGAFGDRSGGDDQAVYDWLSSGEDEVEEGERGDGEAPYLAGLDYSMAAGSEGDIRRGIGRGMEGDSSPSSLFERSLSPSSASSCRSPQPSSSPYAPATTAAPAGRGGASRGRGVGEGPRRGAEAGVRRKRTPADNSRRGGRERGRDPGGSGRGTRSKHQRTKGQGLERSAMRQGRGREPRARGRSSAAARRRPRSEIDGRALVADLYARRLAQQQARGGPQRYGSGAGALDAPSLRRVAGNAAYVGVAVGVTTETTRHVRQPFDGQRRLAAEVRGSARRMGGHGREKRDEPQSVPSMVEDLATGNTQEVLHRTFKFETLYSRTMSTTALNTNDFALEVDAVDPCRIADDDAWPRASSLTAEPGASTPQAVKDWLRDGSVEDSYLDIGRDREGTGGLGKGVAGGNHESGEVVRALNRLRQMLADLEELAKEEELNDEAATLANDCCRTMAVISAKLRATVPSSASDHAFGEQQSRDGNLAGVRAVVERLAEACAPGWGGGDSGDSLVPGLSLIKSVSLYQKTEEWPGALSLVGACAAFHAHLLEWLVLTGDKCRAGAAAANFGLGTFGSSSHSSCASGSSSTRSSMTRSDSGSSRLQDHVGGVPHELDDSVVDFARRLLLDLLFLLERRVSGRHNENTLLRSLLPLLPLEEDPVTELLSVVMDTLDGTRGHDSVSPEPAARVSVPGLAQPLVGFWAVFFEVVSGGPCAAPNPDGGGASWSVSLPSELAWKALLHVFRLSILRRVPDQEVSGLDASAGVASGSVDHVASGLTSASAGSAAASAAAVVAACRHRRKETSKALWECVRLLLAASPFALEFQNTHGQASAITAAAHATMAQPLRWEYSSLVTTETGQGSPTPIANAAGSRPTPSVIADEYSFTAPGMVARALLERVLVLARFCPPEAGSNGIIEKLWQGVQRISATMCLPRATIAGVEPPRGEDDGEGENREARSEQDSRHRYESRARIARRLGRHASADPADLGRSLSAAVEAWCLPVHASCCLPRAVLEGRGERGAGGARVRREGDYEALCSLASLVTQEHAMRLPEGLKRRKLANGLRKTKYSPPRGSSEASWADDDAGALAPSRVLLGIALGLARAGLGADAAKELVKAATIRPRNVTADTPRDWSIALVAPAAAALCLALPRPVRTVTSVGGGGGGTGSGNGVRATLFEVLARCMKDATDLMGLVLDGASKLGQAVSNERLERPRAAIGLVASCIVVALRHLGPLSHHQQFVRCASEGKASGARDGVDDRSTGPVPCESFISARSATVAASTTFVEVLGRALEMRISDRLGCPALTTIMFALLHCWPTPFPAASGDTTATPATRILRADTQLSVGREALSAATTDRGDETGRQNSAPNGRAASTSTACASITCPPTDAPFMTGDSPLSSVMEGTATSDIREQHASFVGEADARAAPGEKQGGELRDEYGSWDGFADDIDLDCLLTGSDAPSQSQYQTSEGRGDVGVRRFEARETDAAVAVATREAEATAAKTAAAQEAAAVKLKEIDEEENAWRSMAEGARTHVLPHLHEILKKSYTVARFAPSSLPSSSASSRRVTAGGVRDSAASAASSGDGNSPVIDSEVNAAVVLKLHAAAALVSLRGSEGTASRARVGNGNVRQSGKSVGPGYLAIRERYLDVHRMAFNPLVPQQRLLAPAFFCLLLYHAGGQDGNGSNGGLVGLEQQDARATSPAPSRCTSVNLTRPVPMLLEALRGREWDILQLWMQAALDPLAFPVRRRRGHRDRRRPHRWQQTNSSAESADDLSDLVREKFEGFTRYLRAALGTESGVGRRLEAWDSHLERRTATRAAMVDSDITGVFQKRLTCVATTQLAALSSGEARVLDRILDMQSVVAHCGSLWASALIVTGPATLPEADRRRIKDRAVKLAHNSIRSLRRFLAEVFPREQDVEKGGLVALRYGSTFRRLYGHAAFSLAAFFMRMCGGALKGLPLRELVETLFDGIACHPFDVGGNSDATSRDAGKRAPNAELKALAVMHLPDLLQCFSEMPMTVAPVTTWLKNINDHAINGDNPVSAPNAAHASSLSTDGGAYAPSMLLALASGLRGDLGYPARPALHLAGRNSSDTNPVDTFVDLAVDAALVPPKHSDPTSLAKRIARMRQEILGDRKLRAALLLMEAATSAEKRGGGGDRDAATPRISVSKTRRLLMLLTEVFRPDKLLGRRPAISGADSPKSAPVRMLHEVVPLMRPVYALLGEALLGEPSPVRRLGRDALACAAALAVAGLEHVRATASSFKGDRQRWVEGVGSLAPGGTDSTMDSRVAVCFAETVVLAVLTKLDTFLSAMEDGTEGKSNSLYASSSAGEGSASLPDLGTRESDLERRLVGLGAWQTHGEARGWPHNYPLVVAVPPAGMAERDVEGTPLSALLEQAEKVVAAFRSMGRVDSGSEEMLSGQMLDALGSKVETCKVLLSGGGLGVAQ